MSLGLISRAGLLSTVQCALLPASPVIPVKTYVREQKFSIFSQVRPMTPFSQGVCFLGEPERAVPVPILKHTRFSQGFAHAFPSAGSSSRAGFPPCGPSF